MYSDEERQKIPYAWEKRTDAYNMDKIIHFFIFAKFPKSAIKMITQSSADGSYHVFSDGRSYFYNAITKGKEQECPPYYDKNLEKQTQW